MSGAPAAAQAATNAAETNSRRLGGAGVVSDSNSAADDSASGDQSTGAASRSGSRRAFTGFLAIDCTNARPVPVDRARPHLLRVDQDPRDDRLRDDRLDDDRFDDDRLEDDRF